ncbi:hypothetical protein [Vulcanisaeta distributa]|uniref:hypothetical protein n=1 Tax=Vulcanisaeta distributa TaxID=164451 RepID=UPI001FB3DF91|nr:hypothetical protein [Vulcanisaeta distributa]
MNELVKELRVNEIINALIMAFRAGNRDYISYTAELLHEEFTYTVSESTELKGDILKRASTLHALYCLGLGLLRLMSNEALTANPGELLRVAVNDGDLTSLTQSLITASALLVKGDTSWIRDFNELTQGINNELFRGILSSFLEVINSVKAVGP